MGGQGECFDPAAAALVLEDGGRAEAHALDDTFWPRLMSGEIDADHGWLVTLLPMTGDPDHWEVHPEGEELLLRQSGAFDVVMETGGGERRVRLDATTPAFVMPRGVWHRFETVEPGAILFATYGRGTEHRPVGKA